MKQTLLIVLVLNIFPILQINLLAQSEIANLESKLEEDLSELDRIDTHNELAWHLRRKDANRALDNANQAFSQSKKIDYLKGVGGSLKVQGALKHIAGKKGEALVMYKRAVDVFEECKDYKGKCEVCLLWGNLLNSQDDMDAAIEVYYNGLEAAEQSNTLLTKASLLMSIAAIKVKQRNYSGTENLYREAIEIQKETSSPTKFAISYYHLATLFSIIRQLDSALVYFNKAERIFLSANSRSRLASVYSSKGNVFFQQKDYATAMELYEKGFNLKREFGDERGLAISFHQVGNLLLNEGLNEKSNEYFSQAFDLAKKLNMVALQSKTLKRLSELAVQLKQPEEALAFYKQHIQLRDSILNQDTDKKIAEIEEKYGNDVLQKENDKQVSENKRIKFINYGIVTVLFFAIMTMFLMFRNYQQKKKHNLLVTAQKETLHQKEMTGLKQQAELASLNAIQDGQEIERKRIAEALHNSMGSVLSAIQMHLQSFNFSAGLKEKKEQDLLVNKTIQLVKDAAKKNRRIAHEMMPPILMRFGLKAALDEITDKLKSPGVIVNTSVFGMEKRYADKLELALYRIIDELLNNILKHAEANEINVQFTEHEESLNIIIEDNGKGFQYQPESPDYGMGLSNIQARIKHFGGELSIDSSPNVGTTVSIDVPVIKLSEK